MSTEEEIKEPENKISEGYRLLTPDEVEPFAKEFERAWLDPRLPDRQHELVVADELRRFEAGEKILPYDTLLECLRELPPMENPSLLDVGAASGYYSEVLRIGGFQCQYSGVDFSEDFCRKAGELWGGSLFMFHADARRLPMKAESFDIVLHGACLMHCREYLTAIQEAARVSRQYVIFHRTPIVYDRETEYWAKDGYGVQMLEIKFEHSELLQLFEQAGLRVVTMKDLFYDEEAKSGHRTYVLAKVVPETVEPEVLALDEEVA